MSTYFETFSWIATAVTLEPSPASSSSYSSAGENKSTHPTSVAGAAYSILTSPPLPFHHPDRYSLQSHVASLFRCALDTCFTSWILRFKWSFSLELKKIRSNPLKSKLGPKVETSNLVKHTVVRLRALISWQTWQTTLLLSWTCVPVDNIYRWTLEWRTNQRTLRRKVSAEREVAIFTLCSFFFRSPAKNNACYSLHSWHAHWAEYY